MTEKTQEFVDKIMSGEHNNAETSLTIFSMIDYFKNLKQKE